MMEHINSSFEDIPDPSNSPTVSLCDSDLSFSAPFSPVPFPSKIPDDSSVPRGLMDEIYRILECLICYDTMQPPIMQCKRGHLACERCVKNVRFECPICHGTLGVTRNLALEKIAALMMFPCKFKSRGCKVTLGLNHKVGHEEICEFHPYNCPIPGGMCLWEGILEEVYGHLQISHPNIISLSGERVTHVVSEINLEAPGGWIIMQYCYGFYFMLVMQKHELIDQTIFCAIVQLIGNQEQAEHFMYRLGIFGNDRTLVWDAKPKSCHRGVEGAITRRDCFVFDKTNIQHFIRNGQFKFEVSISSLVD